MTVCDPLVACRVFQASFVRGGGVLRTDLRAVDEELTPATPTLSDALAVTVHVADTVAPPAGDVTLTVGAVVSP